MNEKNLAVLTNIIGAVESGGQIYGNRRYNAYDAPYKNSPKEHTITIGWAQCYGHEARQLMKEIFAADPDNFRRLDTAGIEAMLSKDWVALKWNPSSKQKSAIITIIDSPVGREVQDQLFITKMKKLVADCAKDYTQDIKAQMMYCEIRHLGGKGPADRIFKRAKGYSTDEILASLILDQKDNSSSNQVGDTRYWSRHIKCKQFIDQYAEEENEKPEEKKEEKAVGVIIGSARGDEYGKASGGAAGDQKQKTTPDYAGEVSFQNWYLHSKGWVVVRAKDPAAREKIAQDMEYACNNAYIGYDQSQNTTLYDVAKPLDFDCSKVRKKCETDCARLVRVCVLYAGIQAEDFYTGNLVAALKKTGQFTVYTADKYCKSSDYLLRGDILVTKTKGHTVVVLSNGSKTKNPSSGSLENVAVYQTFLNTYYPTQVKAAVGALLVVDNQYGSKTRAASLAVWKYMANKYYGASLTVGNANFLNYCKLIAAKMTLSSIESHPTLTKILQGVLAGKGYYKDVIDGIIGGATITAITDMQLAANLPASGELTADTWYRLFN